MLMPENVGPTPAKPSAAIRSQSVNTRPNYTRHNVPATSSKRRSVALELARLRDPMPRVLKRAFCGPQSVLQVPVLHPRTRGDAMSEFTRPIPRDRRVVGTSDK